MPSFPDWKKFARPQRRLLTGCIPAGYEFLARCARVAGVDLDSFQDEFDLDKDKDFSAGDQPENHFGSVADAVRSKYPSLIYQWQAFDTGSEKIEFIDSKIQLQIPVLVSLAMQPLQRSGWHIMPIVDSTDIQYTLLVVMLVDGKMNVMNLHKNDVAAIHDQFDGGKEVAWLQPSSA